MDFGTGMISDDIRRRLCVWDGQMDKGMKMGKANDSNG